MMSPRKRRSRQPILVTLACLTLAAAFAVGLQATERTGSSAQQYGPAWRDGAQDPARRATHRPADAGTRPQASAASSIR